MSNLEGDSSDTGRPIKRRMQKSTGEVMVTCISDSHGDGENRTDSGCVLKWQLTMLTEKLDVRVEGGKTGFKKDSGFQLDSVPCTEMKNAEWGFRGKKKIKRSASATLSLRFLRDIKIEMSKSLRAPEDWVECKFGDSIYMLVGFRARVLPGITPGKRERKEKYRPTIQRTPRFSADGRKKPLQETIEK